MIVERQPGYILFMFGAKDWKCNVMEFLNVLKLRIPWQSREYDADNKTWHISERYADEFYQLRRDFFTDKNQVEIEI
jgi:hypothetical protein